jgi:hypothetical protein
LSARTTRAKIETAASKTSAVSEREGRLGEKGAMPYPNPRVEAVTEPRSPGSLRSRVIPGLLFILLVLAVWADPLFFRRSFAGRDLIAYNLPMEKTIHDAYARGEWPLWSPNISGGRPLLPNPNAGAMYPIRMLLSPVRFPVAAKLFTVLHWAAAGLGILILLGSIGASRAAAWVSAVTYAFSGVAVSEFYFPHIQPGMALLPWIVWAVRRPAGTASRVFVLSLLLALDMLAGDVFTIGLAILCAVAWILCEEERAKRRRDLGVLAGATALAALAALPQIVATVLWVPETNRAIMGIKWREALQYTISPYRLLELVIPYPFGSVWTIDYTRLWGWEIYRRQMMGLFVTLYVGALGVIALVTMWKSRVRGARFARFLIVVALLLSVPISLFPQAWEERYSPLPLRNPEKFTVALVFGLAILAGLTVDELRRRRRLPRWIFVTGIVLAGTAGLAALFPRDAARVATTLTRVSETFRPVAAREIPMALTEAALLWILTWLALELWLTGRRGASLASLALLTGIPIAATRRIPFTFREDEVFAPPTFVRYLQKHDPEGQFRTLGQMIYRPTGEVEREQKGNDTAFTEFARRNWTQHSHVLWGRGTVFNADFDNGDLSRIESARKLSAIAGRFTDGGPYFESLSLRWGTRFRDQVPLPGYHRIGGNLIDDWDENPNALPDIRLARGWREVLGPLPALQTISKLARGEIVIETGKSGGGSAPPGSVRVLERTPARLRIETDSPAPTWLFVLRGFWPHRTVMVDGRDVEVVPAQLAFSAVPVPAGRHVVEWREHFPGWSVSRVGPVLYALSLAFLFARERASRRPA